MVGKDDEIPRETNPDNIKPLFGNVKPKEVEVEAETEVEAEAKEDSDIFGPKRGRAPNKEDLHEVTINYFNQDHCCILVKGKHMVYNDKLRVFMTTKSFMEHNAHAIMTMFVTKADGSSVPKFEKQAKVWLESPKRRRYDGIVFDPTNTYDKKFYNTWLGFATQPEKSDCTLIMQYIHDVLANGKEEVFNWIINFCAHMVQKPWEKPEVAIVFLGDKGVGKSFFTHWIIRVLIDGYDRQRHYYKTSLSDRVFGKFTSQLDSLIALSLEEVTWGGDKKHEGRMKDVISGETLDIEEKMIPAYTIKNLMRIFMSSNSEWVVPASRDERRYMITYVSNTHIQDHSYFNGIYDCLRNGGAPGFMYELMKIDIQKFDHRSSIQTRALLDQKLESLSDVEKFWFGVLNSSQIKFVESETTSDGWICVVRTVLHRSYVNWMKKINSRARILDDTTFSIKLHEFIPKIKDGRIVMNETEQRAISIIGTKRLGSNKSLGVEKGLDGEKRPWCHLIPPLPLVRELWEFRIKGKVDWNGGDVWEQPEYDEM